MVAKTSENVYTLRSKFVYIICFQKRIIAAPSESSGYCFCHAQFKMFVSFESVPPLQITPCKAYLHFSIALFESFILHFNVVETKL